MRREDLAGKVDWEGGVWETICGYGMDDTALPADAPDSVREAWKRVMASEADVRLIGEWLDSGNVPADPAVDTNVN